MTATDFSEFRRNDESDDLAKRMNNLVHDTLAASTPKLVPAFGLHLPYVGPEDVDVALRHAVTSSKGEYHIDDYESYLEMAAMSLLEKQSSIRCMRQTALDRAGNFSKLEADLEVFTKMIKLGDQVDLVCMEHVAKPDTRSDFGAGTRWVKPFLHSNFNGWCQFKMEWIGVNGTFDATVLDLYEACRANEVAYESLTARVDLAS